MDIGSRVPAWVAMVEVRGIEPRSVGTSVAASPSAADGEPSGDRTPSASDRPPYTRIDLDSPVRASRRTHPAKRRPLRSGQEPLRGTGYLSLGSQCKVWLGTYGCYRLFSEDSGDLGSLPTPLLPTSKPVHPQNGDCPASLHPPRDKRPRRWAEGTVTPTVAGPTWPGGPPGPCRGPSTSPACRSGGTLDRPRSAP